MRSQTSDVDGESRNGMETPTPETQTLDQIDDALLGHIQKLFPLDHRPFQILAKKVNLSEQECLERVQRLKTYGAIERISAVFDARGLGYQRMLVAMKVPAERVKAAAAAVTRHPGVSRCVKRNDPFSLWFLIAVPPSDSLEETVRVLGAISGADETIRLSMRRAFTSRETAHLSDPGLPIDSTPEIDDGETAPSGQPPLSAKDIALIRLLQDDLPLLEMPFAVWAEQAETTEEELFDWIRKAQHLGYLRYLTGRRPLRKRGRGANAMVVWQVPAEQADQVGEQLALFREVVICYQRPVYPNWPYPLFTLIRAASDQGTAEVLKRIEDRVGTFPHKRLFSEEEYKAERVMYFPLELDAWWSETEANVDRRQDS